VGDIDTVVVDSLKALDPDGRLEKRTSPPPSSYVRLVPRGDLSRCTKYRQLLDHLVGAQLEGAARAPNALVSSIWPRLDERVCLVLPPLKMALKPPQLH
jgi:hypothetical protein